MARQINIANSKKRDAQVNFNSLPVVKKIRYTMPDGTEQRSARFLKNTLATSEDTLAQQYNGDFVKLGEALISGDPEIDFEETGRMLKNTHKLYLDANNQVVYRANFFKVRKNPQGEEVSREVLEKSPANINIEGSPIQWTKHRIPIRDAVRKFVFSSKYQLRHINGLTFDFLYDMAKELHESQSLAVLAGGTEKDKGALRLTIGSEMYRGFLEGRVDGKKYALILHLSNLELKGVPDEDI